MSDTASAKPSFKDTLNLPQTPFAMKANLSQNEPVSCKRWKESGLYEALLRAREGAPAFVFHDGPPYANGDIHIGHLLNKVLKDLVVRTRLMEGLFCPYVPGWDCHGLPIEHKVMLELIEKGKADKLATLPEDQRRMAIRRECRRYAEKYIALQAGQMQRLLTLADYDHPYLTMAPEYERGTLEVFASLIERGLVYRALKSVHWSIENKTALAEAELEYEDREDLSVYVDFEVADRDAVARAFGIEELDETPCFMIWTTTPWTLPANVAIAVNTGFTYALARIDGVVTIIAKELLDRVTRAAKSDGITILGETTGERLLGLRYRHPFSDLATTLDPTCYRVVSADYVTLEDGTGLVHTAPGHGADDYNTGKREGLPIYCPVLEDGSYDDTVPEWLRGMNIWKANPLIAKRLEESGHLFYSHAFTHSYPHDWRGKSPVIFRATDQWFIGVETPFGREAATLRQHALDAIERQIEFIPAWGRNRIRGMLESRPDWCLSRQRSWGLPIPAFRHRETGEVLLTPASVRAVAKVIGEKGSDAWFTDSPEALLADYDPAADSHAPAWLNAESGKPTAILEKMYDIFDVWFESGSSWNAVLNQRGLSRTDGGPVADLYLEGSDQHRGWFQASLLPSLGVTGLPPYRALLTHGFMVDKDGRKMSKSEGNALAVETLLKDYGADVLRWWVATLAFENDVKVDLDFFKAAGETYRKVRNTLRFLLSNLFDFDASCVVAAKTTTPEPASIDAWALDALRRLQEDVREAFRAYEFRLASSLLYDFCNDTLSAVYCAAVKDRLYCDKADSPRRRRTQAVMHTIAHALCRMLAPIMPHTADETYAALGGEGSVHVQTYFDITATCDSHWSEAMLMRDRALKTLEEAKTTGVENPLDAGLTLPDPDGHLARFAPDFSDLCGVSRAAFDAGAKEIIVHDLRGEPRCERSWKRDGSVMQRANGHDLCNRCAQAVGV